MSQRRLAAALAVAAGIASPAAALAADAVPAGGSPAKPTAAPTTHVRLGSLGGPSRRLRHAIKVQVPKIRARSRRQAFSSLPGGVSQATLDSIASCESGGDPGAVSSDGTYRGKYQFDEGTWASVGGHGDPAAASESEQDYRAALLYSRSGPSSWPICG